MEITVSKAAARGRYEARVAGQLVGFLAYRQDGPLLDLTHTEIHDTVSGRGVGGALVHSALDHIRGEGLRIRPSCPFVSRWIEAHPDYSDLVAVEDVARRG